MSEIESYNQRHGPKAITCIFRRGVMSTLPNMYPIDGRRKDLRKRRQALTFFSGSLRKQRFKTNG